MLLRRAGLTASAGLSCFVSNSSRFRTHRTKCNNSSFRFRFRYENSSAVHAIKTLVSYRNAS